MTGPRGAKYHGSHTTTGRSSRMLRKDLADRLREYEEVVDTTEKEEARLRWMMDEYLISFSDGEITIDQLYPNWLVGVETLSKAIERRVKAQYLKARLITPEQLVIIFRVVGDILESRVKDQRQKQLVAQDIAALIQGHIALLQCPNYKHPNLPETNAVRIIDSAIYQGPVGDGGSASSLESEDAAGDDAIIDVAGDARELPSPLGPGETG